MSRKKFRIGVSGSQDDAGERLLRIERMDKTRGRVFRVALQGLHLRRRFSEDGRDDKYPA